MALKCCKVGLDRPLIPTAFVADWFRSAAVSRPCRSVHRGSPGDASTAASGVRGERAKAAAHVSLVPESVWPLVCGFVERISSALIITPARKFRMLLHINPTRQRGKRTGSLARASGWYMTFFAAGVIPRQGSRSGFPACYTYRYLFSEKEPAPMILTTCEVPTSWTVPLASAIIALDGNMVGGRDRRVGWGAFDSCRSKGFAAGSLRGARLARSSSAAQH